MVIELIQVSGIFICCQQFKESRHNYREQTQLQRTDIMHVEVNFALNFVISYLYNKLPRRRVDLFGIELEKGFKKKFEGHWYPEQPVKGSGFRCVRVNGETIDPVVTNAAECVGINLEEVKQYLPSELTLWIDPSEVSYRIGEKGQIKILYSNKNIEENIENEDTEIQITTRGFNPDAQAFNPDAQSFEPIDRLSVSLGTLNLCSTSEGLSPISPMSSSSWSGSQSTSPLGGPPFLTALGTSSPQSTILPKRQPGIPMFTTATFAQTKFGSTKLKSNAKRPTRLSPIEFGNVFRQKTISNNLQYPGLITPPRSRSHSPHDPRLEFLLDQQQRILHNQQQQQFQQHFQHQQLLIQQQQQHLNIHLQQQQQHQLQQNKLSIPSDHLFLGSSSHLSVPGSLSDMFTGVSPLQSPGHSPGVLASPGLYSSQHHLTSAISGSQSSNQQLNSQGHSTISSIQISSDNQMAHLEGLGISNVPHSTANLYHQLLLAS